MRKRPCSFPRSLYLLRTRREFENPGAWANHRALFSSNGIEWNGTDGNVATERNGRSVLTILQRNGWKRKLFFEGYCKLPRQLSWLGTNPVYKSQSNSTWQTGELELHELNVEIGYDGNRTMINISLHTNNRKSVAIFHHKNVQIGILVYLIALWTAEIHWLRQNVWLQADV